MTEINELKSWIAHAEEDYNAAKALLNLKKPLLAVVSFHAQQCAEKYLKALLILKDVDFPKTHDLPTWNTLCNKNGIFTGFDPQQLADLTKYAVQARYPGSQPTLEEAKETLEIARTVRRFARSFVGLKR
ncbi:MAG TPA: HEPN domain-containing protein [Anaerolineales bacterium]|nr:HEPN domain-containing protein [Anaerolineales bacterium]